MEMAALIAWLASECSLRTVRVTHAQPKILSQGWIATMMIKASGHATVCGVCCVKKDATLGELSGSNRRLLERPDGWLMSSRLSRSIRCLFSSISRTEMLGDFIGSVKMRCEKHVAVWTQKLSSKK